MLNQLLLLRNQTDIVNDPFITRIMTGIHKLRPSSAKYKEIWDANKVFKYLSSIKVLPKFTYTALLNKTFTRIMTGIHKLRPSSAKYKEIWDANKVFKYLSSIKVLPKSSDLVKWSFKGLNITTDSIRGPVINAKEQRKDGLDDTYSQVCPVRHLTTYLKSTNERRKKHQSDSVFNNNDGTPLQFNQINEVVLSTLSKSGIDTTKFKYHSTRSAMASLVLSNNVPFHVVKKILKISQNYTRFLNFCTLNSLDPSNFTLVVLVLHRGQNRYFKATLNPSYRREFIEFSFNGNFPLNHSSDCSSGVQQLSFFEKGFVFRVDKSLFEF
ncbi:hypothetical protein ACTFIZ_002950 [Dictyostelium cf. discoideum]